MNGNYFEMIEDLKRRINEHRSNLQSKDKIINEISDVSKLLQEVRNYIKELKDKIMVTPTPVLKKELSDYLQQEQDYLNLINEYASKINDINISYDKHDYEKDNEFLKIALEFQEVSDKLKEIEKKSLKFGDKNTIGTNRVKTFNAEGRVKYIHQNYLNDYNLLVQKKLMLYPQYQKLYKEFIARNNHSNEHLKTSSEEDVVDYYTDKRLLHINDVPSKEEYENMSNQDKINLEQKYYDNMSDNDKISYCRDVINRILTAKNAGKKKRVKINEVYYYIPERMEHTFFEYFRKLELLTKKDMLSSSSKLNEENKAVDSNNTSLNKVNKANDPINTSLNSVNDNNLHYVANALPDGDVFEVEDNQDIVYATSEKKKQNPNFIQKVFKIIEKRKPKNKQSLIKRLMAASIAIATAITTFLGASALLKSKGNNDDSLNNDNYSSYSTTDEIVSNDIPDNTDEIDRYQNENVDNVADKISETGSKTFFNVNIGDILTVKDSSEIYSNISDAANSRNGLKRYFPGNKTRYVVSVGFKINGQIIYSTSAQEIEMLRSKGTVVAVGTSVTRNGECEGYYNIDDAIISHNNEIKDGFYGSGNDTVVINNDGGRVR